MLVMLAFRQQDKGGSVTVTHQGKVAVVTGGGSGIGLALARGLAAQGAETYIIGRRADILEAAAAEVGAVPLVADVGSAELDEAYRQIRARSGRIDILVANAGTSFSKLLADSDEADFDSIMGVNLKGLYFTVQRALPLLADGGSVVLIGSASAHVIRAGGGIYAASKAAVRSLARTWAIELGARDIRVNVLSPGAIADTPLMNAALSSEAGRARIASYLEATPLRRMGTTGDVTQMLLFLTSQAAGYVTGAEIPVDGGLTQV